MHEQYHLRFSEHGMTSTSWTRDSRADSPPRNILVSVESFDSHVFHRYVTYLVDFHLLSLVVVDEAHLGLTHGCFRAIMNTLQWIGSIGVQVLLLSATAGPSLVEPLFRLFGISQYVVCREKTSRPNISYLVSVVPHPVLELDRQFQGAMNQSESDKAIIYCRTKRETEISAQRYGIPHCHGGMTQDAINAVFQQFRSPSVRAIVCTGVAGVALDIPNIRWVFHLDYPYDMVSYIQETGRAGRAPGSVAYSSVIIPQTTSIVFPQPDLFGAKLIHDWANDRAHCRRWLMQLFNDGVGEPCSMMPSVAHMCDVCSDASLTPPPRGTPNQFSLDLIHPYLPEEHRQ